MQQAAKSLFGVHDSHVSSIPEGGHGSIRMVDPQANQIQSTRINLSGTMDLQRDTTVADAVQSALSSDAGRCGAYSTVSRPGRATIRLTVWGAERHNYCKCFRLRWWRKWDISSKN